jgi:hypothetical protein
MLAGFGVMGRATGKGVLAVVKIVGALVGVMFALGLIVAIGAQFGLVTFIVAFVMFVFWLVGR